MAQSELFDLALWGQEPAEILKKPVQAVHMAVTSGLQNKTQRLAWNAMLKHAHDVYAKDKRLDVDTYVISRTELMQMIGYSSRNRKHLKDVLRRMQDLKVEWDVLRQDGQVKWESCVLLPYIAFDEDNIYYSYPAQIKPMLLDPKTYARLDLRIQRRFRLDCAAALYEWCNRFRTNPSQLTNVMSWEDWRTVIYGIIEENSGLKEYKIFKRDKLLPALAEINAESDLEVKLIEDKDGGRRIKNLQFFVTEKPRFAQAEPGIEDKREWDKRLEAIGLKDRDRKSVMSHYSLADIDAHYRYTMSRVADSTKEPLKSIGAYFKNALEQGYAKEMVREEPAKPADLSGMQEIQAAFVASRNADAASMFNEMAAAEQQALIDEYNAQVGVKAAMIPSPAAKRLKRHMVPMYTWLATRTWGEPTVQEIFEFGLKTGRLAIKPQAKP